MRTKSQRLWEFGCPPVSLHRPPPPIRAYVLVEGEAINEVITDVSSDHDENREGRLTSCEGLPGWHLSSCEIDCPLFGSLLACGCQSMSLNWSSTGRIQVSLTR